MSTPIAYDIIRLLLGSLTVTPRGIDRVDFRYARFFFETWPGDCVGTLPTPWGVRRYERRQVLQGLDRLEQLWAETIRSTDDHLLPQIKKALSGERHSSTVKSLENAATAVGPASRLLNLISVAGFSFGAPVVGAVPKNAIYVNIGQVGLAIPWIIHWLRRRPDVKPVFLLHDVIPLERPELVSARDQRRHRRIVDRTARYASGLIASTVTAREAVLSALCLQGRSKIPVETVPFPVSPVFLEHDEPDQELCECNYFVVCGTIELRKNHHLLLSVWRELVEQRGQNAPNLVIVGSPGWGARPILDALARCRSLHDRVILAHGLSSPALRRLIGHAKALLMPSFAEGFGLPIIEALSVGTPVIASDLPAHREVAGSLAVYHDPTDRAGWLADICTFADGSEAVTEIRRRIAEYQPATWPDYFIRIERFLKTFEQS